MTINVKHTFISAKTDDVDATFVRPSNWNENHTLTMTTNKLLGRGTAADGAVEEITLGTNLALSGTTLNASGATVSAASRLLGRGSASGAGVQEEITLGTNLSMSGTTLNVALGGGTAAIASPQGRLTLQTLTPVMTTTQSAKTTIYYTPYCGNQIGLYDGSSVVVTAFAELSNLTAQSSTGKAGPAAVAASSVYDLFVWNDAGTVRLTRGPAWTNDTTRSAGTALVMVNGLLLNNATITNGPAASRGTYVGTVRSNSSSQIDWILGATAASGTAGFLGVWNAYNRRQVMSRTSDATDSWTTNTGNAWVGVNGSSGNRCSFVTGLAEDGYFSSLSGRVDATNATMRGIGLNIGTSPVPGSTILIPGGSSGAFWTAILTGAPVLGFNYLQALELTVSSSSTFYGDDGLPTDRAMSFNFMGWM